ADADADCYNDDDCDSLLVCNENWGICVADGCVGEDDFTPCKTVTADPTDRSYDICVDEVCVSPGCGDATCNAPGPHFPLADTNQRICFNNTTTMACPASGAAFYGQDAQYGWDTTNPETARFTVSTAVTDYPVVADNVTDLVWQGCSRGFKGNGCTLPDGTATSDWSTALSYCDSLSWGGYTDWRLPDEYELDSIVDAGTYSPSIDTTAFPAAPSTYFWSSSSYAGNASNAWVVVFLDGDAGGAVKSSVDYARCVRGGPTPQPPRFTVPSLR
ncbi:MAG TPA: DUF1566 domain-containing protein, partial [Thermoleophilia bacterium]|nr:DUF1566 domain-containing protein [Thermoleophilia bacterium]